MALVCDDSDLVRHGRMDRHPAREFHVDHSLLKSGGIKRPRPVAFGDYFPHAAWEWHGGGRRRTALGGGRRAHSLKIQRKNS
jgi:hypothetical protein